MNEKYYKQQHESGQMIDVGEMRKKTPLQRSRERVEKEREEVEEERASNRPYRFQEDCRELNY